VVSKFKPTPFSDTPDFETAVRLSRNSGAPAPAARDDRTEDLFDGARDRAASASRERRLPNDGAASIIAS